MTKGQDCVAEFGLLAVSIVVQLYAYTVQRNFCRLLQIILAFGVGGQLSSLSLSLLLNCLFVLSQVVLLIRPALAPFALFFL